MTREDPVLALMADANPVPDPSTFVIDPETRARLETIEDSNLRNIEPSTKNRRPWFVGAAAALLVLIVGLGSLAMIGGNVAGSGEPRVTFDGASCSYTRPGEFARGDPQPKLFVNKSDAEANIGIWRVLEEQHSMTSMTMTFSPRGTGSTVPRHGRVGLTRGASPWSP